MNVEESSDPLPFIKWDRTANAKATRLASATGFTHQHAKGSLLDFWELNGDPRELEKLVTEGKRAVVLSEERLRALFTVASGKDVEPSTLEICGIIEKRDDGYRVRGMSRFFEPIEGRLEARKRGRAGGLASAEARRKVHGTAQPRSAAATDTSQEASKEPPKTPRRATEAAVEAESKAETEEPPKSPEAEVRGQRSDIKNVHTYVDEESAETLTEPTNPSKAPADWNGSDFFQWSQWRRHISKLHQEPQPPAEKLDAWWKLARAKVSVHDLGEAYYGFAKDEFWQKQKPPISFLGFMVQWQRFLPLKQTSDGDESEGSA